MLVQTLLPQSAVEAFDSFKRWGGPGNTAFRLNVLKAFEQKSTVRLVLARELESARVQRGEDGSKIPKSFAVRDDLIGWVAEISDDRYVIEFRKAVP